MLNFHYLKKANPYAFVYLLSRFVPISGGGQNIVTNEQKIHLWVEKYTLYPRNQPTMA